MKVSKPMSKKKEKKDNAINEEVKVESEGIQMEVDERDAKITELQDEVAKQKDMLLRAAAEFDNYKKRTQREKEGLTSEVKAMTIKEIIPVIDNIERAVAIQSEGEVKNGLILLLKQCDDVLKAQGVEEIETTTFDPNLHNAVMHIEDESLAENTITEVFQKGYKIGDKIIRHSMVKVAN